MCSRWISLRTVSSGWACSDGQTFPYLGGVASFDGATWSTYTTANSPLPHNQISSLAADASGNVWVGTASMGLAEILAGVNPLPTRRANCARRGLR